MTRSQLDKLLLESNILCELDDIFGYNRIVMHYNESKGETTVYCVYYEDQNDEYEPKAIESLVKFHGKRIPSFEPREEIKEG